MSNVFQSAGQILGTVIGAIIGGITTGGNPVGILKGAAYGYGIGGAVDPPPGPFIPAPRLDDTSFQSTIMGSKIPWLHGTISRTGRMIWVENNGLKANVKTKKSGGKGGGGGSTYEEVTYTGTFAVQIGLASPGAIIRKIWIGGHLYFDSDIITSDEAAAAGFSQSAVIHWVGGVAERQYTASGSFTFYDGTQTEPSSRMSAEIGAGITPNYRGEMYIVFINVDTSPYGQSLAAMPIKVEFVEQRTIVPDLVYENTITVSANHDSSTHYAAIPQYFDLGQGAVYLLPYWKAGFPSSSNYDYIRFKLDGSDYVNENITYTPDSGSAGAPINGVNHLLNYGPSLVDTYIIQVSDFPGSTNKPTASDNHYINRDGVAISGQGSASVKYLPEGDTTWIDVDLVALSDGNVHAVTLDEFGNMYILMDTKLFYLSPDETILGEISHDSEGFGSLNSTAFGSTFLLYDTGTVVMINMGSDPVKVMTFPRDLEYSNILFTLDRNAVDSHNICPYFRLGVIYIPSYLNSQRNQIELRGYNMLTEAAVGKNLQVLCEDICERVGVTLDASQLSGITVRGMRIDEGTPNPLSTLSALQTAFAFDVVPDGYSFKAVLRSALTSSYTVEYDDLGADVDKSKDFRIKYSTKRYIDLPYKVEVQYLDYIRDYDLGMQSDTFPTDSKEIFNVNLPISMSATEAKNVATTLVNTAHIEKELHELSLPQSFLDVKLSEVLTVETLDRNYIFRVQTRNETANQIIELGCKIHEATTFSPASLSDDARQFIIPITLVLPATAVLLDAPMMGISDGDTYGISYAIWSTTPSWKGGVLYQSSDAGQTYHDVSAATVGSDVATCTDTLSADEGLIIDYDNTLNVFMEFGSFDSVTVDNMIGGTNYFLYGVDGRWEVIQIANFTTESDTSVTADTFIRGAFGTEWATGLHEIDDYLIYVSLTTSEIVSLLADSVGVERLYKAVTFSLEVDDQPSISHTYQGVNLKPLSPVNIYAETLSGDGSMNIYFTKRTRYKTSYWSTGVLPQTEPSINFEIDILDAPGGNVIRTLTGTSSPILYEGSDISTDFGSVPASIDIEVYQISARVGRGYPGIAVTSGTTFVAPTFNPTSDTGDMTYSDGNMVATSTGSIATTRTNVGQSTGKFVWQVTVTGTVSGNSVYIGLYANNQKDDEATNFGLPRTWGISAGGAWRDQGGFAPGEGVSFSSGDIVTMMVDADAAEITFVRNNDEASVTKSMSSFSGNDPYWPKFTTSSSGNVFTLVSDVSLMSYASTLFPGVKEVGFLP